MSVDTYLKNKNTAAYQLVRQKGVEILVSYPLAQRAKSVHMDVKQLLFLKSLAVYAELRDSHSHGRN